MGQAASTPRARRRAKTTARIVETGLRLVTEGGFEALTMQRLAGELDYAAGALYRYFPSKDALLLAVQLRVSELLATDLAERAAAVDALDLSADRRALVQLLVAARVYATLPERRPAHAALLARWLGSPDLLVDTEEARPRVPRLLALFSAVPSAFAAASAAGALAEGDPMRRAIALWAALQGAAQLRKLDRFEVDAVRAGPLVDELLRALLIGWGAAPEAYEDALSRARAIVPDGEREER